MNRMEFMNTLEELLSDISDSEREEAIQYYNDYFDDAGIENEQEVMDSLDSPRTVAETIKSGLAENAGEGEFTEMGYRNADNAAKKAVIVREEKENDTEETESVYDTKIPETSAGKEKSGMSGGTIALIVILCIFAAPIVIPLVIGAVGVVLGIIIAVFGTILGLFVAAAATGLALLLAAVVLLAVGIAKLFAAPIAGIGLAGAGLLCGGLGILGLMAGIWIISAFLPAFCKALGYIFSKIFRRKGEKTV